MDVRKVLDRGVGSTLRVGRQLGRGVADRVVVVAGPPLGRIAGAISAKLPRTSRVSTATSTEVFTPSRAEGSSDAASSGAPGTSGQPPTDVPSPAVVAARVSPARATRVSPARKPRSTTPKDVPGAKLPPRKVSAD